VRQALRHGFGGAQVQHPYFGMAAILVQLGGTQGVQHARRIRRQHGIAYPLHADHVFHRKPAPCFGDSRRIGRQHLARDQCCA